MSGDKRDLASPLARRLRDLWRIFTVNPKVTVGLVVILFFTAMALIGPFFVHTDPNAPGEDILQEPSATHWLGTTHLGQDVFAQLIVGAQISMVMGFVTGTITTIISVAVGLISGYFGGWIDEVFSLFSNVFLVLPT